MSYKHIVVVMGAFLFALLALSLTPAVQAATDGLNASGKILTIDLSSKSIIIKKADKSTVTVKFNAATAMQRNGKKVQVRALMLNDAIKASFKSNHLATKFTATGSKGKAISGKLTNALKGNGTVVIGNTTVNTNAQTRISRNGSITSLSSLTRNDTLTAHVKVGTHNALDLIADGPDDGELHGTIGAISGNQVTVTPSNGASDVVLNVTDSTMIEVNGEHAALGDLAVGMKIEAVFDPATNNAFSIEAENEDENKDTHIVGTVAAVDVGAGTLTITPKGGGSNVVLNVNASTEIKVNDVATTLADVQVGMPVFAQYDASTMLASEVKAGSGDEHHGGGEVEGTVAAVDTGASTVTITPKGGGSNITLNVTAETEIEVNDEDGSLVDIQVGNGIRAEYDPSTNNASELKVGSEDDGGGDNGQVEGTVSAVDTGALTVTIASQGSGDDRSTHDGGGSVVLNMTDQTVIHVNGQLGTLDQVQVGQQAHAKYDAATMNATELDAADDGNNGHGQHEIEGTVSAVDTSASTVTINTNGGDDESQITQDGTGSVTLNITDQTEIQVNGQNATLADVQVGQQAKAEYDPTTMNASELQVGDQGGGD